MNSPAYAYPTPPADPVMTTPPPLPSVGTLLIFNEVLGDNGAGGELIPGIVNAVAPHADKKHTTKVDTMFIMIKLYSN
jgi:hypothetical protein